MKTTLFKSILTIAVLFVALPTMAQDFLNIYFKDGTIKLFYFDTIECITVSKIDGNGIEHNDYDYQIIKTSFNDFIYPIEDIDSIAFTYYNTELYNKQMASTLNSVLPELSDCETIQDAEKKIEEINNKGVVERAWINGDNLCVKIPNGRTISFNFSRYGLYDESSSATRTQQNVSKIKKVNKSNGLPIRAVIANQIDKDISDEYKKLTIDVLDPLRQTFEDAGIKADYCSMPQLDFFYENSTNREEYLNIYDYDIILFVSHGGYDSTNGHSFYTGQELGTVLKQSNDGGIPHLTQEELDNIESKYNKIFKDEKYKKAENHISWEFHQEKRLINGKKKDVWVAYVFILESFFKDIAIGKFPDSKSIFFNAICKSLKGGETMANYFMNDRKLGTYLGYTETNTFGPQTAVTFF